MNVKERYLKAKEDGDLDFVAMIDLAIDSGILSMEDRWDINEEEILNWWEGFKKRLKMCELDPNKYTFHSLRHSRLTHMAIHQLRTRGYVDIVGLAKFAGHSRPDTTMMYVHLAHKYLSFRAKK